MPLINQYFFSQVSQNLVNLVSDFEFLWLQKIVYLVHGCYIILGIQMRVYFHGHLYACVAEKVLSCFDIGVGVI